MAVHELFILSSCAAVSPEKSKEYPQGSGGPIATVREKVKLIIEFNLNGYTAYAMWACTTAVRYSIFYLHMIFHITQSLTLLQRHNQIESKRAS